jgi:ABC-type transport system substrate-binding protein
MRRRPFVVFFCRNFLAKEVTVNYRSHFVWILMLLGLFLLPSGGWAKDQVKEIRIADGKGDWGYPNPYQHYPRGPGYLRMSLVFDTLVWKDAKGDIPALAKSWRYDPQSLSFIFELQDGVLWHDGKPFTADDVVFTLEYFKKHPYQWVPLDKVAGAKGPGAPHCIHKTQGTLRPFHGLCGWDHAHYSSAHMGKSGRSEKVSCP